MLYWPPKAFKGSSNMLATFCSDLGSGAACEERHFGLVVLAWMPEKISSLERKKKRYCIGKKKKNTNKKENNYTNHKTQVW